VFAACGSDATGVRVDIDVAQGVTLASLAMDVSVQGGGTKHVSLPPQGGKPTLPGEALVMLPDVAAQVTVAVTGVDTSGATLTQSKTTTSVPHQQVELVFVLGAALGDGGVPLDGGGATDMAGVLPTQLSVLAGMYGGNGDADGTGTACALDGPTGLVLGGNKLYILESGGGELRTFDLTSSVLATIALSDAVTGNPFNLGGGEGLAYDGTASALYAADSWQHAIRKIDLATGKVSLVAGNPGTAGSMDGTGNQASFHGPQGVALDGAGNLYVADQSNNLVRKVVVATGVVTTVAGAAGMPGWVDGAGAPSGPARFTGPNTLTVYNGDVYAADSYMTDGAGIRKIVVSSTPAVVSTVLGNPPPGTPRDQNGVLNMAGFANPFGVIADSSGNFYVADQSDNQIRTFTLTGTLSLLAGSGVGNSGDNDNAVGTSAAFANPLYLAFDTAGQNLYVTDYAVLRKVSLSGTHAVTTVAGVQDHSGDVDAVGTMARFVDPTGLTWDGADTLYVAERQGNQLRTVSLSTGLTTFVAGGASGAESQDGTNGAASFGYPTHIALDTVHNVLYVVDHDTMLLRKVTIAAGVYTVSTVAGQLNVAVTHDGMGTQATFNDPYGVVFDGDHTLFIGETNGNVIRAFDTMTTQVTTVAGSGASGDQPGVGKAATFRAPRGLAYDRARQILYVAEVYGHCIRQVQLPGLMVTNVTGQCGQNGHLDGKLVDATFSYPNGLALEPSGNVIYVADAANALVRRIDLTSNMVSTVVGVYNQQMTRPGPLPAAIHEPFAMVWTSAGLVVTSAAENAVMLVH
jgi:sugar lactone lactonase YvrE